MEIMSADVLSLVIPTYNEKRALQALLPKLASVAKRLSTPVEFIVVDDNSPDGSADYAQSFCTETPATIRVVKRAGKFGQASAVIEGWRSARGNILGVMDADGAHDESVLPELLEAVVGGPAEIAVGSRFVKGGGAGDWSVPRKLLSYGAVFLAQFICPARDATSGYLLFRREILEGVSMDPTGFRIGLEVMVRGRYRTFTEVPYVSKARTKGGGKVDPGEIFSYLYQLTSLFSYRYRHPHQRRRWTRVVS
jgi:dolichol-phosphate mannosyltransferase